MRIDPANPAAVQSTAPHELHDINMRHSGRLVHLLVIREQLFSSALVTDEELSVDELMAAHLVAAQESVQICRYGARFDRNRIQTEVSTRTIM